METEMSNHHIPQDQAPPLGSANSSPPTPVDRLLRALNEHGCEWIEDGDHKYRAQCPLHLGDGRPLNIKVTEDGIILMKCFHEDDGPDCTDNDKILAAVGLTWWDLFLPSGLSVSAKQDRESGKPKTSSIESDPRPEKILPEPDRDPHRL